MENQLVWSIIKDIQGKYIDVKILLLIIYKFSCAVKIQRPPNITAPGFVHALF